MPSPRSVRTGPPGRPGPCRSRRARPPSTARCTTVSPAMSSQWPRRDSANRRRASSPSEQSSTPDATRHATPAATPLGVAAPSARPPTTPIAMPSSVTALGERGVRSSSRVSGRERRRCRRRSRRPSRGFSRPRRSARSRTGAGAVAGRRTPARGAAGAPPFVAMSAPGATRTRAPSCSSSRTLPAAARA